MNNFLNKNFLKALFVSQNRHHRFGVLGHTIAVTYHTLKARDFKFFIPALLHDIGKMGVAYQDEKDIREGLGELSFTNHEELGYQIVKDWTFITDYHKLIIRHHYLIRGMAKARKKGQMPKYRRLKRIWDGLDDEMKQDLADFLRYDDAGK